MKKLTIALVMSLLAGGWLHALPVDETTAHRVAVNFWNTYRPLQVSSVASLKVMPFDELQHMYVFGNNDDGFVIVAADDCVRPVLGYSFDDPFPVRLHSELRYWLSTYEHQISLAVKARRATDPRWASLLADETPVQPVSLQVVPVLCATKWDQGDPYNGLCPFDSVRGDRAVVGCVATAMAQIMKRWNHPSCGTGSHSYVHQSMDNGTSYGTQYADFANTTYMWQDMPNSVNLGTTPARARALATLSYHCGVAVDMMYGTHGMGGSGAYSSCGWWASECAENAFHRYFKYDSTLSHYHERYQFSDSAWLAMIDEDLAAGRPIYYAGSDSTGGHAFVLDGSNLDTCYHFNWGWNGYGNGYYAMNNLAPGSGGAGGNATYTFNYEQEAIFGIQPLAETFDTIEVFDTICTNYSSYDIYEYSLPVVGCDTLLRHLNTMVQLHLKVTTSNTLTYASNTGGLGKMEEREYCSADGIIIEECTFTKNNYHFIGWCRERTGTPDTLYQPGDTVFMHGNITLYARWQKNGTEGVESAESDAPAVWPNPVNDVLNIALPTANPVRVRVIDAIGRTCISTEAATMQGNTLKLSLATLPSGIYMLQLRTSDGLFNYRIIKQ